MLLRLCPLGWLGPELALTAARRIRAAAGITLVALALPPGAPNVHGQSRSQTPALANADAAR